MDAKQLRESVQAAIAPDASAFGWWQAVRATGSIATPVSSVHSWSTGEHSANAAVDAGAGALLLVSATPPGIHARAVTAIYSGSDAAAVTPHGLSDLEWMRTCGAIRDAMPELRQQAGDVVELLAIDPELAWLTSCIAHAAARRTPVVVCGALATIAALCAQRISDAITGWVRIGMADDDVAAVASRRRMGATAWLESTLPLDVHTQQQLLRTLLSSLDAGDGAGFSD